LSLDRVSPVWYNAWLIRARGLGLPPDRCSSPERTVMPSIKQKTHKGIKKRFKVTGTGKVTHKRCGSSHLNSHKSGGTIRRLRKKKVLKVRAVAQRLRVALVNEQAPPREVFEIEVEPTATEPNAD
jgi:large subunit ribosomal protein L35